MQGLENGSSHCFNALEWAAAVLRLHHPASAQATFAEGIAGLFVVAELAFSFGYVGAFVALGLL